MGVGLQHILTLLLGLQLSFTRGTRSEHAPIQGKLRFNLLKRGDRVRRSTNWTWGSQDGDFKSAKRFGTVLEVVDWHNESLKGLIVHWDLTDQTNIYRYGASNDTVYDVEPINVTVQGSLNLPEIPSHLHRASMTASKRRPALHDREVKQALMALYDGLDGAHWGHREYWGDANTQPCEGPWQGVRCDGNNTIVALDLRENKLSGTLPTDIFYTLTSLVSVNLGLNQISGTIPSQLGLLSRLRFLDLHQNALSGPLPHSLFKCTELEWIDLSANELDGHIPEELSNLQALQYCFLGRNRLDVQPSKRPTGILQLSSLARGHPRLEQNEPKLHAQPMT